MITIGQNITSIGYGVPTPFSASGGTTPYTFSVLANGAGGSIDSSTGVYTAPYAANSNPAQAFDTIQVVDATGAKATATINVCNVLQLLGDILSNFTGIPANRVWLWDQKVNLPTDFNPWIVISEVFCKPFGNTRSYPYQTTGFSQNQFTNFFASVQIDICSRGIAAREQKELLVMALNSTYAQSQQEANSFKIATLPSSFVNLSNQDGAAIPYRFSITIGLQYQVSAQSSVPYFDSFSGPSVTTES